MNFCNKRVGRSKIMKSWALNAFMLIWHIFAYWDSVFNFEVMNVSDRKKWYINSRMKTVEAIWKALAFGVARPALYQPLSKRHWRRESAGIHLGTGYLTILCWVYTALFRLLETPTHPTNMKSLRRSYQPPSHPLLSLPSLSEASNPTQGLSHSY